MIDILIDIDIDIDIDMVILENIDIDIDISSQAGLRADGAGESALPAEEPPSAGSANSENSTR